MFPPRVPLWRALFVNDGDSGAVWKMIGRKEVVAGLAVQTTDVPHGFE